MPTTPQHRVTFEPQGRTVYALPGTKVLEAAGRAGLSMIAPCGGRGTCGKCRVQFTRGACPPSDTCRKLLDETDLADGWRLACQANICADAVIHVPETSQVGDVHQIFTEAQDQAVKNVLPAVRKIYFELTAPTLSDDRSDLERLEAVIGPVKVNLRVLRKLGKLLRDCDFKGTAVVTDHHLVEVEPGDTRAQCYGVAFDIGTTTVVGSLMDLGTGRELAIESDINPQVSYGDDVLSRIARGGESAQALIGIRGLIVEQVNALIARLCERAGISPGNIYEVTFAGNTTMEHLLCGIDPTPLGQVPFVAVHGRGLTLGAAEVSLTVHPNAAAYVFPTIGGFVGGDTVAGVVATGLLDSDAATLLVDIGTNGEIVMAARGELWATSTAAGPAFEGARITSGMRAASGAIEKVVFSEGQVQISTIGNAPPIGICGSALVDVVAELLRTGIVTCEGRMLAGDELPAELGDDLRSRVVVDDEKMVHFMLTGTLGQDRAVSVTQRDIRELQLATGAIRAGVTILMQQAGVTADDVQRVLIAGGFGSFIRRSNAQRIGLMPSEIDRQKINYVGNASLKGAMAALVSTHARRHAEDLARKATHVQLSEDLNFQMLFAESMIFPEN